MNDYLEATATISPCGLYRYTLTRLWNPDRDAVVFCMLNPSTADGTRDDPTIRRCVAFADAWGYGRLVVVNLFAFRATDPDALGPAADPAGPDNDTVLGRESAGRMVVAAWGTTASAFARPTIRNRPLVVLPLLRARALSVRHLGLSKDGHPRHPLYLRADCRPLPFPSEVPA